MREHLILCLGLTQQLLFLLNEFVVHYLLTIDLLELNKELILILNSSFMKLRIVQQVIDFQNARRYGIHVFVPAGDIL